jgi:hypothetical protein
MTTVDIVIAAPQFFDCEQYDLPAPGVCIGRRPMTHHQWIDGLIQIPGNPLTGNPYSLQPPPAPAGW